MKETNSLVGTRSEVIALLHNGTFGHYEDDDSDHKGSIYGYRTGDYHLPQHDIAIALSIDSSGYEKGYALFGPAALPDGP